MKYKTEIEINLPVKKVIQLFDNPDNLKHWMAGLQSFEHLSGTPGQPGAKSRLRFKMGNRDMELIETVTKRNLPEEFTGTYETNGVFNIVKNTFEELPGGKTRYVTENEFQFQSLPMKIMGWLMPGAFKKQSFKYLQDFKAFAESQPRD